MLDAKGLLPAQLEALCADLGEAPFRGRQLFHWLHASGARSFEEISVLPRALRARLAAVATPQVFDIAARQEDPGDKTAKYLFRLTDGETVETVLMRYRFGWSACISSQVGCSMGCRFCASTVGGLVRNLTAGELAEQVVALNRDLEARGDRVARIVVMGMGEPLNNLDNVLQGLRILHEAEGCGIGWRHMTVSTSGIVPGIDALAAAALPITLAVSLHAPTDELRSRLMPVNRQYPLGLLLAACRRYFERTGRRLTFEYVLIDGVNDLPEQARELVRLLRGLPCHVNLIPLNRVEGRGLRRSRRDTVERFARLVAEGGLAATVRRQLGSAIDAACGQLRRRPAPVGRQP